MEEFCMNDYECKSNDCSDSKCVSTYNLLQRILDFLKNIFGFRIQNSKSLNAIGLIRNKIGDQEDYSIYNFTVIYGKINSTHYWYNEKLQEESYITLSLPRGKLIEPVVTDKQFLYGDPLYEIITESEQNHLFGENYYGENVNKIKVVNEFPSFYRPEFDYDTTTIPWIKYEKIDWQIKPLHLINSFKFKDFSNQIKDTYNVKISDDDYIYIDSIGKLKPTIKGNGIINVSIPIFYSGNIHPTYTKIIKGDKSLIQNYPEGTTINYINDWLRSESLRILNRDMVILILHFLVHLK